MACDHKIKVPLSYYYDDDWGHKGDQVWYNDPNQGGKQKEGRQKEVSLIDSLPERNSNSIVLTVFL